MDLQLMLSRIEGFCEARNLKRQKVYIESGVGKDFGGTIRNGSEPSVGKIFAVAKRLDCSVDYLLGRTENPLSHKNISITTGDIKDNHNSVIGNGNSDISITVPYDKQAAALLDIFNNLDLVSQLKLVVYADELNKSK